MAEKLTLDDGILELDINGNGLLRFNPSDPNVYQRFVALARALPGMEDRYKANVEEGVGDELTQAGVVLEQMKAMDTDIKARLGEVFGETNDFDRLLGGVNLMAVGRNGQRVVTNLLAALSPYMEAGIGRYRENVAAGAVSAAQENRARRRAK